MVTVHCGVSNLRDKETTPSMIKRLAESITSLKEALPEIKIAISTPTPVGERKLEIERNSFNAEAEKQLLDILDDKIFFIDHSNLSDRGLAIKDFYREDEIHLSRNGTHQFRRNLKAVITETLKNGEKVVPERNREDHESMGMPRKRQQNNGQYEYRAQGSRQHDDNSWRKPGQYEDRDQGSRQLDNYGWGKPGQYAYRA